MNRSGESDDSVDHYTAQISRFASRVVTYSTASIVPVGKIAGRTWGEKQCGGYSPWEGYEMSRRINERTNDPPKLPTSPFIFLFCIQFSLSFSLCLVDKGRTPSGILCHSSEFHSRSSSSCLVQRNNRKSLTIIITGESKA